MDKRGFLSDADFQARVLEIAARLDGLNAAQIEHLLRTVSQVVARSSRFSVASDDFRHHQEAALADLGADPGGMRQ